VSDRRRSYPDLSGFSGAAGIRPAIYRGFAGPPDVRRYSNGALAPCLAAEGGKARSRMLGWRYYVGYAISTRHKRRVDLIAIGGQVFGFPPSPRSLLAQREPGGDR